MTMIALFNSSTTSTRCCISRALSTSGTTSSTRYCISRTRSSSTRCCISKKQTPPPVNLFAAYPFIVIDHQQLAHVVRQFGTSSATKEEEQSNHDSSSHHGSSDSTTSIKESENNDGTTATIITNKNNPAEIVYRGGLADATLRLKRVSITTCMLGLVGMPLLAILYGSDVSSTGQMAVGGTAIVAATGSTAALTYCISPYVHLIERFDKHDNPQQPNEGSESDGGDYLLQATTRNIFARERKTLFDPTKDISHNVGSRPFCNFIAKGVPMYVHPDLIEDEVLRKQLVGEKAIEKTKHTANQQKDDEFL